MLGVNTSSRIAPIVAWKSPRARLEASAAFSSTVAPADRRASIAAERSPSATKRLRSTSTVARGTPQKPYAIAPPMAYAIPRDSSGRVMRTASATASGGASCALTQPREVGLAGVGQRIPMRERGGGVRPSRENRRGSAARGRHERAALGRRHRDVRRRLPAHICDGIHDEAGRERLAHQHQYADRVAPALRAHAASTRRSTPTPPTPVRATRAVRACRARACVASAVALSASNSWADVLRLGG